MRINMKINMAHGSGGKASSELMEDIFGSILIMRY
jgi:hypothetical protein